MKSRKTQLAQIGKYVREVVKREHPETVENLTRLVQQKYGLSEQKTMDSVCHAGLCFTKQPTRFSDLKHYMTTAGARWYWFIMTLCMLTATVVLILPAINPVVYMRYLLGSVFVFWMPGYCLVKSLFPGRKLEKMELIALSLGTSIVLVPMMTFVLHYTPWGIGTVSATVVLIILTVALSSIAIVREHQELLNR
jgi:hypothetical protein